jgi:acyl carrier protein
VKEADLKTEIMALMKRCWPHLTTDIRPEKKLREIGLDSLDYVEFLTEIDSVFGVRLGVDEFERLETVEDLCALVAQKAGRNGEAS